MRIERLILPNAQALDEIAKAIWQFAQETEQRPQVVLSTSGPANALRRAMERLRPKNLPKEIVFLPKISRSIKYLGALGKSSTSFNQVPIDSEKLWSDWRKGHLVLNQVDCASL